MAERTKIFIDGASGTVGLKIHERLKTVDQFQLLEAPQGLNRDIETRHRLLNEADIAVLCLPDRAAREAMSLVENPSTRILDASSAHRITNGWVYGLPELTANQDERIANAGRVANPGCFATGSILLLRPLVDAGLIPANYPVSITGVTGYTGGGRRMIEWHTNSAETCHHAVVTLDHRHVPEVHYHAGLAHPPICMFSVSSYPQGMVVQVPLALWSLPSTATPDRLHSILSEAYKDSDQVHVRDLNALNDCKALDFTAAAMAGRDDLEIFVAHEPTNERVVLTARFDNLGKGASGAALRNLELMTGLRRPASLEL